MASRTFEQILAEVTSRSDPQRKIILDQIAALPTQLAADEKALDAKKDQAFDDILVGARRRGLGFSGIPLGEQAQYSAKEYAPALVNLRSGYNTRKRTLESALADIGRSDHAIAYDMFDRDRAFAEQQRQFNEQLAAQQRAASAAATRANPYAGLFGGQSDNSSAQQKQSTISTIMQGMQRLAGNDGKVSPDTYRRARSDWQALGYKVDEFDRIYSRYINPSHWYDYLPGPYSLNYIRSIGVRV